ncbi:MAG: hypothetical protein QOD81_3744 [Solirubrobacteraceae bacterium]|nr:hypothetical protein [Solirubrobacteraceae bacterium]
MHHFIDRVAHAVQQRSVSHELFPVGHSDVLAHKHGVARFTVLESQPGAVTIAAGGRTLLAEPLELARAVLDV